MSVERIVYAILDETQLTLYKADGETIKIPQGDVRVQRIVDEATTPLSTVGYVDIEIGYPDQTGNHYKEVEEQASGLIKFFRVAKKLVKNLFNPETDGEHVEPVVLGRAPKKNAPAAPTAPTTADVRDATDNRKTTLADATAEIMKNAKPASDPDFKHVDTDDKAEEDTMIAVVQTDKGPAIVPGVENISNHMRAAAKLGSTEGVQNFLKRLAAVINDRGHSVEELLNFMSKGDLPIADDGSIIGYKVLSSTSRNGGPAVPKGYYVDCHSGKVLQRVGSYVTQEKVDPSRRTECSTGLHIARRRYLGNFPGDIITLVKIAPEDVIAVPHGEPDKMRARGYHILDEIPKDEHARLRANQPVEGMVAKQLLGMAIRGEHIGIIEDVVIGGPYGNNLKVTVRQGMEKTVAPTVTEKTVAAEPLSDPSKKDGAAPVDAKGVSETTIAAKQAEPIKPVGEVLSYTVQRKMFMDKRYADLIALKKAKKKSWALLGFSDAEVQIIIGETPVGVPVSPPIKPVKAAEPTKAKPKASKKVAEPVPAPVVETPVKEAITEQRRMYDRGEFTQLYALKKAKKKSWDALGFSDTEQRVIANNPPKK